MGLNRNAQDPRKCHMYARFMKGVSQASDNATFWALFVLGILLLCVAACCLANYDNHKRAYNEAVQKNEFSISARELKRLRERRDLSRTRCLCISVLCICISIFSIVIQAFAGLSLMFCHVEDLMVFYWGAFFALSVGSLIAMVGVAFGIACTRNLPWNVPLGTPVLVIAGIGHTFYNWIREEWRYKRRDESRSSSIAPMTMPTSRHASLPISMSSSTAPTIQGQEPQSDLTEPEKARIPL